MKAIKENRVYTITEADQKRFIAEGYDIRDDDGNLIAFGAGKTVPFGKYAEALKRIEDLTAENVELRKKAMKAKEEEPKAKTSSKSTKK